MILTYLMNSKRLPCQVVVGERTKETSFLGTGASFREELRRGLRVVSIVCIMACRPYGNGGFMSAGRSSARPVQPNKQPKPHGTPFKEQCGFTHAVKAWLDGVYPGEKKGNQKAEQSKKGKRQRQANEQLPQASQK